jgi:hypothetical protein
MKFGGLIQVTAMLKLQKVLDHFTEKSFYRIVLTEFLTETPFDKKAIRPKHHLTAHRLTECHLTESSFDRITI